MKELTMSYKGFKQYQEDSYKQLQQRRLEKGLSQFNNRFKTEEEEDNFEKENKQNMQDQQMDWAYGRL